MSGKIKTNSWRVESCLSDSPQMSRGESLTAPGGENAVGVAKQAKWWRNLLDRRICRVSGVSINVCRLKTAASKKSSISTRRGLGVKFSKDDDGATIRFL